MARIEQFEDLLSWQKGRQLTQRIYQVTKARGFAQDYALRDQIRRATVSILSNIAEGFERGGDREFRQFLSLAKGSCAEVRAQLYVALDEKYFATNEFLELKKLTLEISRLISGMMTYLATSTMSGHKFKTTSASPKSLSRDSRLKTQDFGP